MRDPRMAARPRPNCWLVGPLAAVATSKINAPAGRGAVTTLLIVQSPAV